MAITTNKRSEYYFGNNWAMDGSTWRVRWNVETGALYAVDSILPWRQILLGTFETLVEVGAALGETYNPEGPDYHNLALLMERAHQQENHIPNCRCGATPEMVDAGKAFYVQCGVCKFRGKPAYLEGLAIRAWKFALRKYEKERGMVEIDYGVNWTVNSRPNTTWRVSWDPATGMLYAFQARDHAPDQIIHLFTAETREEVDVAMGAWDHHETAYYRNLYALRTHLGQAIPRAWEWGEVIFRIREGGDESPWEEIPVTLRMDSWDTEYSSLISAGVVATWLLNKTLKENKANGKQVSVSIRYNIAGSYQGHYVDRLIEVDGTR